MGFKPRKRCVRHQGKIKTFPADDSSKAVHMTGFMAFKAGMTHVVRELDRLGSKSHKKEIVEAVTILEAPPVVVIGLVGYLNTPRGMSKLGTVWAEHLSETAKRRFVKRYNKKTKVFSNASALLGTQEGKDEREAKVQKILKNAQVIRAVVHSQPNKLGFGQKKGHVMELQVNGGSVADKVKYVMDRFEKEVSAAEVFAENEMIDVIGITKGHGYEGVTARWGVTKLPRKTHRGLRKVACIGAWHPARVSHAVPRAGQDGYHHRVERNKKIYRLGKAIHESDGKTVFNNASTAYDLTQKSINPMGGFPNYGVVRNDFIMVKGCVAGVKKRMVSLRKTLHPRTYRAAVEKVDLKFIDTASKMGHGRFQTRAERIATMGLLKKDLIRREKYEARKAAATAASSTA
jgi:large subunit ribosomal protein L3e